MIVPQRKQLEAAQRPQRKQLEAAPQRAEKKRNLTGHLLSLVNNSNMYLLAQNQLLRPPIHQT